MKTTNEESARLAQCKKELDAARDALSPEIKAVCRATDAAMDAIDLIPGENKAALIAVCKAFCALDDARRMDAGWLRVIEARDAFIKTAATGGEK